jgi:hypothetical protein
LNAVVGPCTRVISPSVTGTLKVSTGWTQNADYTRSPTYFTAPVRVDVQALTAEEIRHVDALNIQGTLRGVWFNGRIEGLDRPAGKGGDILVLNGPGVLNGTTWLCVHVMEQWDESGWVHVVIQLQDDTAPG